MRAPAVLFAALLLSSAAAAEPPLVSAAPAGNQGVWRATGVVLEGQPKMAATLFLKDWEGRAVAATLRDGRTLEVLAVQHNVDAGVAILTLSANAPDGLPLEDAQPPHTPRSAFIPARDGQPHPVQLGAQPSVLPLDNPLHEGVRLTGPPPGFVLLTSEMRVAGLITLFAPGPLEGIAAPAALIARLREDAVAGAPGGWGRIGFSVADEGARATVRRIYEADIASSVRPGDDVWEIDGVTIRSAEHFRREVLLTRPGAITQLALRRDGASLNVAAPVRLGDVAEAQRGGGAEIIDVTPSNRERRNLPIALGGAVVMSVEGELAARGLRRFDRIVAINGEALATAAEAAPRLAGWSWNRRDSAATGLDRAVEGAFARFFSGDASGEPIRSLDVERNGQRVTLDLGIE